MEADPKAGPGLAAAPAAMLAAGRERLELGPGQAASLVASARAAAPEEACGLLLGRRGGGVARVREAPRVPNRAADPRVAFELEPGAWAALLDRAEAAGLELLGVWHSHPRGPVAPSAEDRRHALPGCWNLVVTPDGEHHAWRSEAGPPPAQASSQRPRSTTRR